MSLITRGRSDAAPFAESLPIQLISREWGSEQGVLSRVPERCVYAIQDSLYRHYSFMCCTLASTICVVPNG